MGKSMGLALPCGKLNGLSFFGIGKSSRLALVGSVSQGHFHQNPPAAHF